MTAFVLALALASSPAPPPEAVLNDVDVIEQLGAQVPGGLTFVGPEGPVRLDSLYGRDKPILLLLTYGRCPSLCGLTLNGLVGSLKRTFLSLEKDYLALTVSLDPRETPESAAKRQRGHLQALGRPEATAAWPFWTGTRERIDALADAVGIRYVYDAQSDQYAHPSVVVLLSPEGRVVRYLYGIQLDPRDLKLALLEAGEGRVGTTLDRVLLRCYRYDPKARGYLPFVRAYLQVGGLLVFAALAVALGVFWRRELRKERAP